MIDHAPLLCLLGAERLSGQDDFPGAPLADGALVPSAVARVLGMKLAAEREPVASIAAVLAARRLLLVLDNCEHLTGAVAAFVETVAAAAPGLRVLVTSQETLKTGEEGVYRVGALA